jgi:hypothetical protein
MRRARNLRALSFLRLSVPVSCLIADHASFHFPARGFRRSAVSEPGSFGLRQFRLSAVSAFGSLAVTVLPVPLHTVHSTTPSDSSSLRTRCT